MKITTVTSTLSSLCLGSILSLWIVVNGLKHEDTADLPRPTWGCGLWRCPTGWPESYTVWVVRSLMDSQGSRDMYVHCLLWGSMQLERVTRQRAVVLLPVSSLLFHLPSLHPGVRQNLLKSWTIFWTVWQTPANQRLAFWEGKGKLWWREETVKGWWRSSHLNQSHWQTEPVLTFRDPSGEYRLCPNNLLVTFEWDVAAHHVKE